MAKTPGAKTAKPLDAAAVIGAKGAVEDWQPAKGGKAAAPLRAATASGTKGQ